MPTFLSVTDSNSMNDRWNLTGSPSRQKHGMEYRAVLEALDQLQKRERYILLARILEERSFTELAQELQIGYKGAAAIYYRALSRIREKLEEET